MSNCNGRGVSVAAFCGVSSGDIGFKTSNCEAFDKLLICTRAASLDKVISSRSSFSTLAKVHSL